MGPPPIGLGSRVRQQLQLVRELVRMLVGDVGAEPVWKGSVLSLSDGSLLSAGNVGDQPGLSFGCSSCSQRMAGMQQVQVETVR